VKTLVEPLLNRYRLPQVVIPIQDDDIANKKYVDDAVTGALPPLLDGKLWIGNAADVAIALTIAGDGTIDNAGVLAIGLLKITNGMLAGSIATSKISGFDTQVRTSTLNQMAPPTAELLMGTQKIGAVVDPTTNQQVATKKYVDDNSGSTNTFARIVKKADQTISNSTTFTDDAELLFTPTINKTYGFQLLFFFDSSAVANFKLKMTLPTGATGDWVNGNWTGGGSAAPVDVTAGQSRSGIGAVATSALYGRIIMAGNAGDVVIQWAQNTAEISNTKMLQGSFLVVWEEV